MSSWEGSLSIKGEIKKTLPPLPNRFPPKWEALMNICTHIYHHLIIKFIPMCTQSVCSHPTKGFLQNPSWFQEFNCKTGINSSQIIQCNKGNSRCLSEDKTLNNNLLHNNCMAFWKTYNTVQKIWSSRQE